MKAFKLFVLDVGLLSSMVRLNQSVLLNGNELFKEFKGALTEQYVLQQLLTSKELETYYWTNDRGNAEVDFLLDNGDRVAMSDYKKEDWVLNLPLWDIESLEMKLNKKLIIDFMSAKI